MCLDCERKLERHGENMKTPSRISLMWGHSARDQQRSARGQQEETSNKAIIREVIYWNWLGGKEGLCNNTPQRPWETGPTLCLGYKQQTREVRPGGFNTN